MGKSTIPMVMFNSFLYVYQAGYHLVFKHGGPLESLPTQWRFQAEKIIELDSRSMIFHDFNTQMLHVWNIYLHLPQKWHKCR